MNRQEPTEDDYQHPHSVRNLVIGTGVLGAIALICWYGTSASQSGSSSAFIACSAANCPAAPALPLESPAAAQANASGSSNPKAIDGQSSKQSGSVAGLSPIINALVNPPTTGTGTTVGPVVSPTPQVSSSGTVPTTPGAKTTTPATTAPATTAPATTAPATTAPTTVLPTITITASLAVTPTSAGPVTS